MKNEKLDFDRGVYLEQYRGSEFYRLMSGVANTQMFEQVKQKMKRKKNKFSIDFSSRDIELIYNWKENWILMNLILK